MKKILLLLVLQSYLHCSTLEQVEQYLSVSHAEENILLLESHYANMQNSFSQTNASYDMQLLMFRFKESLQKQLSENEMDEVLTSYKNMLYLQFVSNQMTKDDFEKTQISLKNLQDDPDYNERMNIINDINKALNKEDIVGIMYDDLMTPFLKNSIGGKNISNEMIQKQKDSYIKSTLDKRLIETLYVTKEFSIDELEDLRNIVNTTAIRHETKAVYKATAFAFKEFFLSIAKRYDLNKHQPKSEIKTNSNI